MKRIPRMWDEERDSPWLLLLYAAALVVGIALPPIFS